MFSYSIRACDVLVRKTGLQRLVYKDWFIKTVS